MGGSQPGDAVAVANPPAIPGLAFRAFRGPEDFPLMLAVRRGSLAHDQIDPQSPREHLLTVDELARSYAGFAPGTPDMLFAEIDGHVVGYNRVVWWPEQDGQAVFLHLGYLLPAWRGHGIGTAMFGWAEARCRSMAHEHLRGRADLRLVYATNASSTEREATRLIERAGYTVVRRLADMRLERSAILSDVPLPVGLELRAVIPQHYPALYDAMKDAWEGMWGVLPPGEDDSTPASLARSVSAAMAAPSLFVA